jgi:glutathione S-transferase
MATQSTTPTLHHLSSSGAQRVLWALEELHDAHGLVFHLVTYPRTRGAAPPELKQIQPLGRSPTVVISDGLVTDPAAVAPSSTIYQVFPGVLTEGRAIISFFNDEYAQGLWTPESPEDKRRDAFWTEFAQATVATAVQNPMMFELIGDASPWFIRPVLRALNSPIVAHFRKGLPDVFQMLENALQDDDKPYFSGAKLGIADFHMSWPIHMAVARGYVDEERFPKLKAWFKRVSEREAYQRALGKGAAPFDMKMFNA